mgnify:CR=1 FL=1
MTNEQLDQFRIQLEAERASLSKTLAASKESAKGMELDQTRVGRLSRMDALQSQAISQGANRQIAAELEQIRTALERIASGDYGTCVSCGKEIPLIRLEIYPWADTCVQCAQRNSSASSSKS